MMTGASFSLVTVNCKSPVVTVPPLLSDTVMPKLMSSGLPTSKPFT